MARDLTAIVKRSRREGVALHPKAHKMLAKTKTVVGGPRRRVTITQYGTQLREKQKVKRFYGLLERQFRTLVTEATRMPGVTGENLLQLLERRLDNVVYRAHLAVSRQAARQLVTHGHLLLNGRRVDVPSIRIKIGDVVEIRPASIKNKYFEATAERIKTEPPLGLSWLNFDAKTKSIKITALPTREEAEMGINEHLIIEFYSR